MTERNGTKRRIRVAAEIEQDIIALMDRDRKGKCSRAAIIRIALIERYQSKKSLTSRRAR